MQLFAKTSQNEVVGTTWWEILREIARPSSVQLSPNNSPFWLLGGRLLAFPDRSPVFLTDRGSLPQKELKDSGSNKLNHPPPDSIPRLEEFLLGIEQKERGDNSASFDMQWNDALVVLCKESDRSSLVTLQQLESQFAWRHLSWVAQILLGMGCMILLLIGLRADRKTMLMLAALITVATLASAMLTLRHGILIPWMAPALVSLGLLIQGVFHKFPR